MIIYIMIVTMAIVQSFALTSRLSSPLLSISLKESNTIRMQSSNINVNDLVKPVVDRIKPVVDRIKHRINPLIDKVKLSLTKIGWTKKVSKEDIAKLGLFTLLSYGWVSNVSYITCLIISWIIHGKEYGLSPLASGQWKSFLTIYAALWAANNVLRPFRVTFALFLAPYFEKWVDEVEKRSGFKRATSTGIVIFLFNICGTISYLVGGLFVATKLAGVPLLP